MSALTTLESMMRGSAALNVDVKAAGDGNGDSCSDSIQGDSESAIAPVDCDRLIDTAPNDRSASSDPVIDGIATLASIVAAMPPPNVNAPSAVVLTPARQPGALAR